MPYARYPSLLDKVVFITGGGSGIGAAMVEAFVVQKANVAFVDVQVEPSRALAARLAASGQAPLFIPCDLTDLNALEAAMPRNAGVGHLADFSRQPHRSRRLQRWRRRPQRQPVSIGRSPLCRRGCQRRGLPGLLPSFCTACYRLGRTGQDFMDIAKPGEIKYHCHPNALSTFQEYLCDYAGSTGKIRRRKTHLDRTATHGWSANRLRAADVEQGSPRRTRHFCLERKRRSR